MMTLGVTLENKYTNVILLVETRGSVSAYVARFYKIKI